MQVDAFFHHWGIAEHPFRAEEARDDPVFMRLMDDGMAHPDFEKIYGQPQRPAASVVFGEKGSGKTALRLLLERRFADHNEKHPDQKVWVIRYDDLNGVLDRFAHRMPGRDDVMLERFTLADHQDAILSLGVTSVVDGILEQDSGTNLIHPMPDKPAKVARRMPRPQREDLAVLAALYDQPRAGDVSQRQNRLRRVLRLRWFNPLQLCKWLGGIFAILALGMAAANWLFVEPTDSLGVLVGAAVAMAIGLWGGWAYSGWRRWMLARRIRKEVRVVERTAGQLYETLGQLRYRDLASQPLPVPGDVDSRYQLTARFRRVLQRFGYKGLIVLVDRVDEPVRINGDPQRMQSMIWPMLNNKFLQQDGVGIKMLLPVELRHQLMRENADFFQRARLDKQSMIERLIWSGVSLYDLCTVRLQACQEPGAEPVTLSTLFDDDVTHQELIDALEQMLQPRDAFKFLYQVIQEHCLSVPHDQPVWKIPRLTLQSIRKKQAQRVQELQRGLTPA